MQRQIKREKTSTPTIYHSIEINDEDSTYTIQQINEIEEEEEQVTEYDDDDDDVHNVTTVSNIEVIDSNDEDDVEETEIIEHDEEEEEEEEQHFQPPLDENLRQKFQYGNHEFSIIPKPAPSTSKSKSHYCSNCGNCYGAAGSLKLHVRACLKQKETEERAIESRKCHICGRIYNSISYLKEHLLRHSGKGPRKCPRCRRKFMDKEKYEKHLRTHRHEDELAEAVTADALLNDDDPSKNIQTEDTANSSNNSTTTEKKTIKEYQCSFCHQKFTVIFDSRSTKRRYACDDCRIKFANEENLRKHKESLEEKKDFRCDRCGRKFIFEGFLQRHAPTCDGTIKRKRDRV